MKKIIILSISFAVLAAGLVLGYIEYNKTTMNSLLMANLEILAHAEDGDGDGGGSGGGGNPGGGTTPGEGDSSPRKQALYPTLRKCTIVLYEGNGYIYQDGKYWTCVDDEQGVTYCSNACKSNLNQ